MAKCYMILLVIVGLLLMSSQASARKLLSSTGQDATKLKIEGAPVGSATNKDKKCLIAGGIGHYAGIGGFVGVGGLPIMHGGLGGIGGVGGVGGLGGMGGGIGGLGGGIAKGGAIGGGIGGGIAKGGGIGGGIVP